MVAICRSNLQISITPPEFQPFHTLLSLFETLGLKVYVYRKIFKNPARIETFHGFGVWANHLKTKLQTIAGSSFYGKQLSLIQNVLQKPKEVLITTTG